MLAEVRCASVEVEIDAAPVRCARILEIVGKAGDAQDFVPCRRVLRVYRHCAEGQLKCAVNLVLLVISEVSGGETRENSIDGKFLELA